jgi:lactoylglutathione lyase
MTFASFGFTKLIVGDLEKSAAFYKSVCGVVEQARIDGALDGRPMSEILFDPATPGGPTLVLFTFHDTPKPATSEVILGFITPDLDAVLDRVRAAGGSVVEEMGNRPELGVKVAIVRDIEGHLIEVVQML